MSLRLLKRAIPYTLTLVAIGCRNPTDAGTSTGLTGTVTRGPVTPTCQVNVPCDAPFAAHFSVVVGGRSVASFQSDVTGAFAVHVSPGNYVVVPGTDAPIPTPSAQGRAVTVGPSGLTVVHLSFDTGIR
jgi:hypothetical protein